MSKAESQNAPGSEWIRRSTTDLRVGEVDEHEPQEGEVVAVGVEPGPLPVEQEGTFVLGHDVARIDVCMGEHPSDRNPRRDLLEGVVLRLTEQTGLLGPAEPALDGQPAKPAGPAAIGAESGGKGDEALEIMRRQGEGELRAEAVTGDGPELEGEGLSIVAEQRSCRYGWAVTGQQLVDPQFVCEVAGPGFGTCIVMVENGGSGAELVGVRDRVVTLGHPGAISGPVNRRQVGSDRLRRAGHGVVGSSLQSQRLSQAKSQPVPRVSIAR